MTIFRAMLGQLGLDADGAVAILGQSPITVRRKAQGVRNATDEDVRKLRDFWWSIQSGDIDRLPEGVREAAMARKVLRGVCGIDGPGRRIYEDEAA
ncbi:hypothetical protein [Aurantimonas coralicida]|uniref:hypothetical protein n=1 Tax=Aurantimonas coralicida TaxID=182270 RepID=UPI001D18341E|nr:hypothetical protein [Aurantimonas coralicida]MCC4296642.1 hypothetical protein [Aurantimonas coralicida]